MPRPHALIIEPEPDIAPVVRLALAERGYRVVAARALFTARHLRRRGPPELVLLDASPSDARDLGPCEQARVMFPAARLVVLTTSPHTAFRQACLAAGVDALVVKPFDPDALAAEVGRLVLPPAGGPGAPGGGRRPVAHRLAPEGARNAEAV